MTIQVRYVRYDRYALCPVSIYIIIFYYIYYDVSITIIGWNVDCSILKFFNNLKCEIKFSIDREVTFDQICFIRIRKKLEHR